MSSVFFTGLEFNCAYVNLILTPLFSVSSCSEELCKVNSTGQKTGILLELYYLESQTVHESLDISQQQLSDQQQRGKVIHPTT